MNLNISQRDKKILIIGIAFVTCYLLFFFVAEPIYKNQAKTDKKINDKIQFIQRYYEVLNQKTYYQEKDKANKDTHVSLTRRFLQQKQPGLAAASLQKLIESFLGGTVTLERTKVNKPKHIQGMLAVPIEITVRSDLKNLSLFLMKIENHEKLLIVEELQLRRINKTEPDDLQTRLMVTGFIQELESQGVKPL